MKHQHIYHLLSILNPAQKEELSKQLQKVPGKTGKFTGDLSNKLILTLMNCSEIPTQGAVIDAIYGSNETYSANAYKKLIQSVYKKTVQLVIAGFASPNFVKTPPHEYIKIDLLNKIILIKILRLKGANVNLLNFLQDEIINMAEEYEFYPILMEKLATKKIYHGMKYGFENVQKLSGQISLTERSFKSLVQAIEWSHELKPKINKVNFGKKEKDEILRQIDILEKEVNATGSNSILYYMLNHKLYYYNIEGSIEKRKAIANKIIELIQNCKAVYSDNRLGIIYSNLSEIEACELNYASAILNLEKAKKYFPKNSKNYFLTILELFRCHLHTKDLVMAAKACKHLKTGFLSFFNEFEKKQIRLLEACLFIKEGKYEEALYIMNDEKFENKNPSFEFWRRVYQILLHLKL
ncbi:MAG: hypothetical protein H0X62_16545, partial [Bacteroidetes bacterium]|nr:hypothetical protein [Bacteroidota bacterium]